MKKLVMLLVVTILVSSLQYDVLAATNVNEGNVVEPVASYDASDYNRVEAPANVGRVLHLESNGSDIVDAVQDVSLEPSTEYLIVFDITENTYKEGYFVAVRSKGFSEKDILFPKEETGEYRALFTTLDEITNSYIWSYAYNNKGGADMTVETTFDIYEADQFENPLTDDLTVVEIVEEETQELSDVNLVASYNAADYSRIEAPASVGDVLHLESDGSTIIDALQDVSLKPETEYLIVFDITKNTYKSGYFVAVRSKNFSNKDVIFPKGQTGEYRATFTTDKTMNNSYIWSYAYNNTKSADMEIETTFKIYEADQFENPLTDELPDTDEEPVVEVPVVEEPVVEEPVIEEPVVEEPVVEEPVVEEPVVEEPVVEEPVVEVPVVEEPVVEEPVNEFTPVVSYDADDYSRIETPATVGESLILVSDGTTIVDAIQDVTLEPSTEYVIVYNITKNTYENGYFVAVRGKEFADKNVLFPKGITGEYRATFTTDATMNNSYIWSYAYNNTGSEDMMIEATFDIYKADQFENPLTDSIVKAEGTEEEPVVEEPVVEEPVVEEPVVEEPVIEEPVVEEPVVEAPTLKGVRASEYGMVANSKTAATDNATLFFKALNENEKIIIDGKYYMGKSRVSLNVWNVEILGENNAELVYTVSDSNQVVFDSSKLNTFKMEDVDLTNTAGGKLLFVYNRSNTKTRAKSTIFRGCTFDGNISAYRLLGDRSTNPATTEFGIDSFVFENNEVYDTNTSMIILKNVPFDSVVINNNKVRNFESNFADLTVSNDIPYSLAIRNMSNYLEVVGNDVYNDNSWFSPQAGYHTFVITENIETLYDSNRVEGLKSKSEIAIYDAYLSCDKVTYTNNLWKNNIAFYADKITNTLIKAKTGYNATRLYENNTFIVEEGYADAVGANKDYLYVNFIDINKKIDSFQIIGNTFDIYDLRFQISSREVEEYVFNDNVMKAKYTTGKMFMPRLVDGYQTRVEFSNNDINIEQDSFRNVLSSYNNNFFGLIQTADYRSSSSSKGLELILTGNTIVAPIEYALKNIVFESYQIKNNDIRVVKSLYKKFSTGGSVSALEYYTVGYQSY